MAELRPKIMRLTLPTAFTADGLLPPGDYELTLEELRESMLVKGPHGATDWDARWRGLLVVNLALLVRQLWGVGIREIFIDGSFVEDKNHPRDIDGYFVCDKKMLASGHLQRELNLLNDLKAWTWDPNDRQTLVGQAKRQLPMWVLYKVELYPHYPGAGCGLFDEAGNEMDFPAAFRRSRRDGKRRGIVKIVGGHPYDS